MVVASLAQEHEPDQNIPILNLDLVSRGIVFIQKGQVAMFHMDQDAHPIVNLCSGSYFGDVSYIFKLINKYKYMTVPRKDNFDKQTKFYSLKDKYIRDIFERFPEFENVFRVRALRRHHYFRRLRRQIDKVKQLKLKYNWSRSLKRNSQNPELLNKCFFGLTDNLKDCERARLVEENIKYDDLAVKDNFSDNEISYDLQRTLL